MELTKAIFAEWGQSLEKLGLTPSDIDTKQLRDQYKVEFTLEDGILWLSTNPHEALRILDSIKQAPSS